MTWKILVASAVLLGRSLNRGRFLLRTLWDALRDSFKGFPGSLLTVISPAKVSSLVGLSLLVMIALLVSRFGLGSDDTEILQGLSLSEFRSVGEWWKLGDGVMFRSLSDTSLFIFKSSIDSSTSGDVGWMSVAILTEWGVWEKRLTDDTLKRDEQYYYRKIELWQLGKFCAE